MRSLFFSILLIFFGMRAQADGPTLEDRAEDLSAEVQRQVGWAADHLDIFLSGKRYTSRVNDSHVNVSEVLTSTEGNNFSDSTDVGLNLQLPNLQKRWSLRFSSYDEDAEDRDMNQRTVRTTPRPRDLGTALILFKKLGQIKTSFQPRLQISNPLSMNYTLRLESEGTVGQIHFDPRLEFFADSSKGTGEFFSIDILYKPGGRWQYGTSQQEEYDQNGNDFTTGNSISTGYRLSDTQALSFATVLTSENHNFHLNSITPSLSYGQQIYPKILHFTLSPYLAFAHPVAFKGQAGISLVVDATF